MSWFNIGDECHDDPRFREVGLAGCGLFAIAGSYCMDQLTDGFVPKWFVKSWPGGTKAAKKLVAAGIWANVDGGCQYVEWKEALTRAYVEAKKKKWRDDKAAWRAARTSQSEAVSEVDSTVDSQDTNTNTNDQQPTTNTLSGPGVSEHESGTSPARARASDEPKNGTAWPRWCGVGPDPFEEYR